MVRNLVNLRGALIGAFTMLSFFVLILVQISLIKGSNGNGGLVTFWMAFLQNLLADK